MTEASKLYYVSPHVSTKLHTQIIGNLSTEIFTGKLNQPTSLWPSLLGKKHLPRLAERAKSL